MRKILIPFVLVALGVVAFASPVRSMLGADWNREDTFMPTAADYIGNGLVALYDGIENAGWGEHNASPGAYWKELVNGDVAIFGRYASYDLDHYQWTSMSAFERSVFKTANFIPSELVNSYKFSITFVFEVKDGGFERIVDTENNRIFKIGGDASRARLSIYGAGTLVPRPQVGRYCFTLTSDGATLRAYNDGKQVYEVPVDSTVQCDDRAFAVMRIAIWNARFYNRALSQEEIAYNNEIDIRRFGL